ncbi:DUF4097 family beta strand repeat-containing protein [Rummeliibacillus pycnus]|uniref:DUF4097 family beta strand repeat-containing protein n=1 Tax=Rummeliibacillus pycnus TaxID=101070 RepID=UPI0037C544D8
MTEQKYLIQLEVALQKLNPSERRDILRDFKDYFENGRKEGKSDGEIISSLGTAEEIAVELLKVYTEDEFVTNNQIEPLDVEQFQQVNINIKDVNVIVKPSPDHNVYSNIKDQDSKTKVQMKNVNGTLHITIDREESYRKFLFFRVGLHLGGNATVTLQVPEQIYDQISIDNDNGYIKLSNQQSKVVTVETDNGSIEFEKVLANEANAKTDNGDIIIEQCQFTDFYSETDNGRIVIANSRAVFSKLRTDNGRIELESLHGDVDANTANGRIEMYVPTIEDTIHLETDMGRIQLLTDRVLTNGHIQADSDLGKIEVFGQSGRNYIYGNGLPKVRLKTAVGKIIVDIKSNKA